MVAQNMDAILSTIQAELDRKAAQQQSLNLITQAAIERGMVSGAGAGDAVKQMLGLGTGGLAMSDAGKEAGTVVMEGLKVEIQQTKVSLTLANQIIADASANARSLADSGRALWLKVRPGILAQMEDDDYAREWAKLVTPFVHELLLQRYGGEYGHPQVP